MTIAVDEIILNGKERLYETKFPFFLLQWEVASLFFSSKGTMKMRLLVEVINTLY